MVTSFHHCATSSWAANELFHSYNFTKFFKYFMREPNAVCSLRHSELDSPNSGVCYPGLIKTRAFPLTESVVSWEAEHSYCDDDVGQPQTSLASPTNTRKFNSSIEYG